MPVIAGDDYYTIATKYAEAFEGQVGLITKFYEATQALKCLDDIEVTVALLGDFHTAYTLNKSRLESTQGFEAAVLTLQQHITSETGLTASQWITQNIKNAGINANGIPYAWALLSKAVGYNIDDVVDSTTESSSSSDSSQSA